MHHYSGLVVEKRITFTFSVEKKGSYEIFTTMKSNSLFSSIHSLFKLDNHFSEEGYSNSFEFLFNPDPSRVNCFDIN